MQYEATKTFRLGGIEYHRGDPFDPSLVPDRKLAQLLDQRYLRPAVGTAEDVTPEPQP